MEIYDKKIQNGNMEIIWLKILVHRGAWVATSL